MVIQKEEGHHLEAGRLEAEGQPAGLSHYLAVSVSIIHRGRPQDCGSILLFLYEPVLQRRVRLALPMSIVEPSTSGY